MNDAAFQDDHACAARRSCTVVGRVALLEAIVRCEVGLVRGKDKTVWGLLAPQRQGSEEALIVTLSQLVHLSWPRAPDYPAASLYALFL